MKRRSNAVRLLAPCIPYLLAAACMAQAQEDGTAGAEAGLTDRGDIFTDSEEHWYGLDAPTSPDYELDEIFSPHTGMFRVPLVDGPINGLLDIQRQIEEDLGLRIGFAYTQLYQQASGGPGDRWGMAGDADLLFDWALVGRGTDDVGRFFFSVEERFRFASDITPAQLSGEIGSVVGTGGPFNNRGLVIRDAFWEQRLLGARLRVLAGRAAPDDYVGAHRLASANFAFFNASVAGNPTMAAVGHGPLALVSIHPTDYFYATLGGANAYSVTTQSSISSLFDEGRIYGFGEVGVTSDVERLGPARLAFTGWNMPARELDGLPSDWGFSITVEQYVGDRLWFYGRYGYANEGLLTGIDRHMAAAVAVDGLLGSPDNLTGLGVGYAVPASDDLRDQKSVELFHLFQLTEHTQLSAGAQAIIDPANAPDDDVVGIFSLRLRVAL